MIYHREKWFIDRIGKDVFRKKLDCRCKNCQRTKINIHNPEQAQYMHILQECGIEYFDNPIK